MKDHFLLIEILFLNLIIFSCLACSNDRSLNRGKGSNVSINVCYSSVSATQIITLYAYDKGIFTKHGLDVNLLYVGGGSNATRALASGQMDICQVAGPAVIYAAAAGIDLAIIAGLVNTNPYTFMVSPGIKNPEELRGKSVAISDYGGSTDFSARTYLKSIGLIPDVDVSILSIGGQSERIASMRTGQVDGTLTGLLQTAYLKELGFYALVKMRDLKMPYQHTALATNRKFITKNRPTVIQFLEAVLEAISLMREDHEGLVETMANHFSLDIENEFEILMDVAKDLTKNFYSDLPYPTSSGVQVLINGLETLNPNVNEISPSSIIDSSLIKEIVNKNNE